jgi:hypothetical protein
LPRYSTLLPPPCSLCCLPCLVDSRPLFVYFSPLGFLRELASARGVAGGEAKPMPAPARD